MNCQEKAAFIIPTFNAEKYICQCLDSILNQNYSNFITIIINDGSTDSTSTILDLYKKKDSRIIVIDQNNQGQAAARNEKAALAQRQVTLYEKAATDTLAPVGVHGKHKVQITINPPENDNGKEAFVTGQYVGYVILSVIGE